MKKTLQSTTLLAGLLLIVGCKAGPNYKRPTVSTPADFRGALAPEIAAGGTTTIADQQWTSIFGDHALQSFPTGER